MRQYGAHLLGRVHKIYISPGGGGPHPIFFDCDWDAEILVGNVE